MKLLKLTALSAALLSTSALADWSANVGMVSDYHFRGIQQTQSASASAGVDYEQGGFYERKIDTDDAIVYNEFFEAMLYVNELIKKTSEPNKTQKISLPKLKKL